MYIYTYTHINVYRMFIQMYIVGLDAAIYVYVYICIYMYIYIHTCLCVHIALDMLMYTFYLFT